MADITDAQIVARTRAMRLLSDADRRAATDAAENVIGFGRFGRPAKLTDFAAAYPVRLTPEPA